MRLVQCGEVGVFRQKRSIRRCMRVGWVARLKHMGGSCCICCAGGGARRCSARRCMARRKRRTARKARRKAVAASIMPWKGRRACVWEVGVGTNPGINGKGGKKNAVCNYIERSLNHHATTTVTTCSPPLSWVCSTEGGIAAGRLGWGL